VFHYLQKWQNYAAISHDTLAVLTFIKIISIQDGADIVKCGHFSPARLRYGNVSFRPSVCPSVTAGIVSKWLNLSKNFFDHLVVPSLKLLWPLAPIPNSKVNPFIGGVKCTGVRKWAIFVGFSLDIAVYLGNSADRPMVAMKVMGAGLNGIIFDDLEWPIRRFQGHCIITSRISQKRCVLRTKLLRNTNRKPYTIYRMITLPMTLSDLWPWFQGHDIFRHWISQKRHQIEP